MLLYYSCLVGYFKALYLGMTHTVQIMLLNCENIEKHTKKIFDIDYEKMSELVDMFLVSIADSKQNDVWKWAGGLPESKEKALTLAMLKAIQQELSEQFPIFKNPGLYSYSVAGSHLPTNANLRCSQTSIFTKQMIKGLAFSIDSVNMIAIEEALEWAFVNKWTPCNTGTLINPF